MANGFAQIELIGPKPYGIAAHQVTLPASADLTLAYSLRLVQKIGFLRLGIKNLGPNPLTAMKIATATLPGDNSLDTIVQANLNTTDNFLYYALNAAGITAGSMPAYEHAAWMFRLMATGEILIYLASDLGCTVDLTANFENYAAC